MNTIELKGVRVDAKDEVILEDINLGIAQNSIQLIIGPSGAGKTTLLKAMLGLFPYTGKITFKDDPVLGYIPQHLGLVEELDALTNVLLGSCLRSSWKSIFGRFEETYRAKALLEEIGLKNRLHTKVKHLSGGEKRRIAIARAFLQEPDILFADEMLSDLDFYKIGQMTNMLQKMKSESNMTIIMVEHDLKIAKALGDNIAILRNSKLRQFSADKITQEQLMKEFVS